MTAGPRRDGTSLSQLSPLEQRWMRSRSWPVSSYKNRAPRIVTEFHGDTTGGLSQQQNDDIAPLLLSAVDH